MIASDQRGYFVYEDIAGDPSLEPLFDAAVREVEAGAAVNNSDYPPIVLVNGQRIAVSSVMEYFLACQMRDEFDAVQAKEFVENIRHLVGWKEIDYKLRMWFEVTIRNPFLAERVGSLQRIGSQKSDVKLGADLGQVNSQWLEFACWIAVDYMKYGLSSESITANEIFDTVTLLGSDLPARMKKYGSGELPEAVIKYKDADVSCVANDVFATIRISVKTETEANYRTVLEWLCQLLGTDFPHSYAITFRSPVKSYLPIKGLPKKGVHQLFANAVAYPALRPLIEQYARLAMREFEWYTNIDEEDPALPGTFAVFALVMADDHYLPLGLDYLRICDGEDQRIQGKLVHAYIAEHGFTPDAIALLLVCVDDIDLDPIKTYPVLVANEPSLDALVAAKRQLADPYEESWDGVIYAIWGLPGLKDPQKVIDKAPDNLKPLYQEIFEGLPPYPGP